MTMSDAHGLSTDFICMSNDSTIALKTGHTFAEVVAIRMNVSYSDKITPKQVVDIFKGVLDWRPFGILLSTFFDELSAILIKSFMDENNITLDEMSCVYWQMPCEWQSSNFIKFMEDYKNGKMGKFITKRY